VLFNITIFKIATSIQMYDYTYLQFIIWVLIECTLI